MNQDNLDLIQSQFTFWKHLSTNEQELLLQNIKKVVYKKGHNLHSADNECLGVLLIKSGELRVYMLSEDGREITLYRLTSGDICILSASCILNSISFDVYIDAEADTEVLLLNISTFALLNQNNIYVENFAYKNATEHFSDIMYAVEQILFIPFDKRLAAFLLDETRKNKSLEIILTQEQIAKYVGSAREVVSRMLKTFQSQGIIEQSRGRIRVTDKEKLQNIL